MNFRNAQLSDLPMIVEIYNSTIPGRMVTADLEPVSVNDKLNWFHAHNEYARPLWVMENESGEMIGWISFQDFYGRPAYQGTAEISIYLHEKSRGKGIGRLCLDYAIQQAPALNIHTLLGFIFEHNEPSIGLFKKMGFEEWAHLKNIALLDNEFRGLKILGRRL